MGKLKTKPIFLFSYLKNKLGQFKIQLRLAFLRVITDSGTGKESLLKNLIF